MKIIYNNGVTPSQAETIGRVDPNLQFNIESNFFNKVTVLGGEVIADGSCLTPIIDLLPEMSFGGITHGRGVGRLHTVVPPNDSGFDVVRALDTGTEIDENGLVVNVDANIPRFNRSGVCPILIKEKASTNILPTPNDFTSWSGPATFTANTSISPDGTQNASRVSNILGGAGTRFESSMVTISPSTEYAGSIYVKGEGSDIGKDIDIALKRGSTGTFSRTIKVVTLTDDWVRIDIPHTFLADNIDAVLQINNAVSADSVLIWHDQLELGSISTTPIIGGSTRNTDVITDGASKDSINSVEGVLFVRMRAFEDSGIGRLITVSDGTSSNRIQLYFSTSNVLSASITIGGVEMSFLAAVGVSTLNFLNVALLYDNNKFELYVDGVLKDSDVIANSFTPDLLNDVSLSFPGGSIDFEGEIEILRLLDVNVDITTL